MAPKLQVRVKEPALSLGEVKEILQQENPSLANPLKRSGARLHCLEVFGQSCSIRDGFRARGMEAESFDIRA